MTATISLEGLWSIINSLSIKNKKWLAEKLNEALEMPAVDTEQAMLSSITRSINEAQNGQVKPIDTLWDQL